MECCTVIRKLQRSDAFGAPRSFRGSPRYDAQRRGRSMPRSKTRFFTRVHFLRFGGVERAIGLPWLASPAEVGGSGASAPSSGAVRDPGLRNELLRLSLQG